MKNTVNVILLIDLTASSCELVTQLTNDFFTVFFPKTAHSFGYCIPLVMVIGVSQRINVCAGCLTALVRYFWIIKEDRTKDLKVFLPCTAVFVLLSSSLKAFTVTSSSAYFRCRERLDAQHFGPTENGSILNFYEGRPFNKADFNKTVDLIFIIVFFVTKLILYYKIFKYVSEAQKISNLDKNVKRKKFKRDSFFTLRTNILEVVIETFLWIFMIFITVTSFEYLGYAGTMMFYSWIRFICLNSFRVFSNTKTRNVILETRFFAWIRSSSTMMGSTPVEKINIQQSGASHVRHSKTHMKRLTSVTL